MPLYSPFEGFSLAGIGLHNSPDRPSPDLLGNPLRGDHGGISVRAAWVDRKVACSAIVDVSAFRQAHQKEVLLKLASIFVVARVDPIDAIIESTCAADTDAVP